MRLPWKSCRTVVVGLVLGACSGTPTGTVTVVTGEEADVLGRAPAVVTLVTEKIALDGTRTEVSRAEMPIDTVRLGDEQRTAIGALAVTGLDATGKPVVRGESLFVQWGALEDATFEIFVQRTGELARVPRGPNSIDALAGTMIAGRYVFAANGTATMLYDLLALKSLSNTPVLPRPARSVASVGTALMIVDEAGATIFDLATGAGYELNAPTGGSFSEVSGGSRVGAPDGTQFIVGGSRSVGGPSARVLVIDPEGRASFAGLTVPREGACATFVEGRGLVVVGGDPAGAGAELLAPGATIATPLPFPADPVRGCGATALDNAHVAVAGGGDGPVRVFDLACSADCAPAAWPDSLPLAHADTFSIATDAALVVGDDASGTTRAYRVSASGTREIALRNPRRGARLLPTPTGAFVVFGGGPGIEQYID